jgi:hypothetical protein
MRHISTTRALVFVFGLATGVGVLAADATPASDPTRPVTTVRVGGSPADAAFRAAQQKSGAEYRMARAACPKQPAADRAACIKAARDQLRQSRAAAAAAHRARP